MRTLAFDGRMGASGDMILGALLAAGASRDALGPVEAALEVSYRTSQADKNGIAARNVEVLIETEPDGEAAEHATSDEHTPGEHEHTPDEHTPGEHEHTSDADHDHHAGDHHETTSSAPAEAHGPHRSYRAVLDILSGMELSPAVEADARAIFERLGRAEAAIHDTELEATEFHEVGADDAIADVVGAALLLDELDVDRVVTTPLSAGGGEVRMSHGTYPVPAPAVVEIAERADWSIRGGPVDGELLTPTGAAILAHYAEGVETLPELRVEASGYGAGNRDHGAYPNVLRCILGETAGGLRREPITVLETNLDDTTPEILGSLQERLAAVGALDVTVVPTTTKKSRPGHLVSVVTKAEDAGRVAKALAVETGTLGVRERSTSHRWVAGREFETATVEVDGRSFEVAVKIGRTDEEIFDYSAEFDDAVAVSEKTDLPVREVMRRAETAVRREENGN